MVDNSRNLAISLGMEQFTLLEGGSSFNDRTIKSVYTTQEKSGGKQMVSEEKKAAVHEEIKKVNQLPAHSTYATHRIWVGLSTKFCSFYLFKYG
ncbi:hypothetical protein L1887_03917 [Cichorium endivia]|nr:hypothetical protein L1887_03917 [Cichorium endivia]